MKVRRRTVPLDMMSAESKDGRRITVMTHGHRIVISTNHDCHYLMKRGEKLSYSFDELFNVVQMLALEARSTKSLPNPNFHNK